MKKYLSLLLLAGLLITLVNPISAQRTNRRRNSVKPQPAIVMPVGYAYIRAVPSGIAAVPQDISWIYIQKDGLIIKDPKFGVNPVDLPNEKKNNAGKTGHYTVTDNKMLITWENGKTAEWKVDYKDGDLVAVDGVTLFQPAPMPANYRLAGQFSASSLLPSVSNSTTLLFSKDGSFSENRIGGVTTGSGSVVSQDLSDGNYIITGNTLHLNYEGGKKSIFMIALWTMANGKKQLVINGASFPQE